MRLQSLLSLEALGRDKFRAPAVGISGDRSFGGQVLAQALMAALGTVCDDRFAHSIHAHFMRPGDNGAPVNLAVERLRDGRSFSTRSIRATQYGRDILCATVSCHSQETGLEHQLSMPPTPHPETLTSEADLRKKAARQADVSIVGKLLVSHFRVEMRPVTPRSFVKPKVMPPRQDFWIRLMDPLPLHDWRVAQGALTYLSDLMLLSTTLLPHGIHWSTTSMDSASLDHSLWLHCVPDLTDWLLWSLETPWSGSGRGLARGSFYSRGGDLIASATQEGLIRLRQPDKSHPA